MWLFSRYFALGVAKIDWKLAPNWDQFLYLFIRMFCVILVVLGGTCWGCKFNVVIAVIPKSRDRVVYLKGFKDRSYTSFLSKG